MNYKRKVTVTATILIIATILAAAFAIAATTPQNLSADMETYKAQAQTIFDLAYNEIQTLRNVTLPKVNLVVVTKQWAIDTWGKGYADPDLANILREERVYKGLFMMPQNASLYEANVNWAGNFGAASWNGQIYVVKENFNPWIMPDAEATFIHELTHIWQPNLPYPTTFDEDKAHTALIEGDASFMGDYFKNQTQTSPSPSLAAIDQVPVFLLTNPAIKEVHTDTPQTISLLNWFPYTYGTPYIDAAYKQNGWASVNQLYNNPPNTTEQILHPEKFFANETAQPISAPTLTDSNWTQIKNNRYGEYFIQVMLGNWLSQKEAVNAAAGWAGDNFTYYENGGNYLFTWNIKWDTSCDAGEFYVAFNNILNATSAEKLNPCVWTANGTYITIVWNQDLNATRIAVSTLENSVVSSAFN